MPSLNEFFDWGKKMFFMSYYKCFKAAMIKRQFSCVLPSMAIQYKKAIFSG